MRAALLIDRSSRGDRSPPLFVFVFSAGQATHGALANIDKYLTKSVCVLFVGRFSPKANIKNSKRDFALFQQTLVFLHVAPQHSIDIGSPIRNVYM